MSQDMAPYVNSKLTRNPLKKSLTPRDPDPLLWNEYMLTDEEDVGYDKDDQVKMVQKVRKKRWEKI